MRFRLKPDAETDLVFRRLNAANSDELAIGSRIVRENSVMIGEVTKLPGVGIVYELAPVDSVRLRRIHRMPYGPMLAESELIEE